MDKYMIINVLRENKYTLKKQFNILKVGLFGSYSSNSHNQNSDFDLVYELEEGEFLGLKELYDLETFVKDIFKVERVDLVNQKYMNHIIECEMNKTVIYV